MKESNQPAPAAAKIDAKDKQNSTRDAKTSRPRSKKQQVTFGIALVIACLIGTPFAWYAYSINQFAKVNSPDWFFP